MKIQNGDSPLTSWGENGQYPKNKRELETTIWQASITYWTKRNCWENNKHGASKNGSN